ncbi:hypothetical protein [Halalkalibacter krulwichiae]|uniref:Flagellar hook-length control protein FliK n=1 Tax=Halalkalibacter krulwichiae TaxID=199441 RepID=A0A1X9M7N4_9BACI|nr:hypothetical protein [Halalkalibacter krulwichiae]ARK29427.1 hypothetical protein BkAM31D_05930 [Halalkalibacter krulwichiae]
MQIQHQHTRTGQQIDRQQPIANGETYPATIKEQTGRKEAILVVRGREVNVQFEGEVPQTKRVFIQVTDQKRDVIQVRAVEESRQISSDTHIPENRLSQAIRQLGVSHPSPELNKAVSILIKKGVSLSRDSIGELQRFMNEGNVHERIQTVQAIALKKLEVTRNHLDAVHEALHGKPLNKVLSTLVNEMDEDFNIERGDKERLNRSSEAIKDQLNQINETESSKVLIETRTESRTPDILELVRQSIKILQKEANFDQALQRIQSTWMNQQGLTEEWKSELIRVIETANTFYQQGRELKARQELAATLDLIEQNVQPIPVTLYEGQEQIQMFTETKSKTIAVTTVTEKVAQLTADFKHLQRDITRTLDQAIRQLEQFRNLAQSIAKPLLETTIKKLDNAILKSEMMLFADMKTERLLMQASSQLNEARKLLSRGNHEEAQRIVQGVKQLIEKLNFQPSETKVKHYTSINERTFRDAQMPSQLFLKHVSDTVRGPMQEGSPRAMFETIRSLGLNRDSETAQFLASGREPNYEQTQRNIKTSLMQLSSTQEEGTHLHRLANQALTNVTGQQLLNRSDQQGNLQSLFFQLPFLLENKVENLQVVVNSRNENEKVDWENCSLFFLMETPKMGEIGIAVAAKDRQLSVTIKNNREDFQMKMAPLVQIAVDKLSAIGYAINEIKYAKLHGEIDHTSRANQSHQRPVMTEKGFDFKI